MTPSLRVQTVLYNTSRSALERFCEGISAACALARQLGLIGSATLWVGDSSSHRLFENDGQVALDLGGVFASVHYVHYGANLGSAGGHNRLFRDMTEDLALVINPDTYAAPRLVTELVTALVDPTVGIVEPRQLPLEHPKAHDPRTSETSWASGACFLVRTSVVREICGFDDSLFFLHGDDVDFSWRARLAGWRVLHRPSARVFHDKRLSDDGVILAGQGEIENSARAAVLLPWRYSRFDLAMDALAALESATDELSRRVAADLRARMQAGTMPEPIDPNHTVAQFAEGNYAVHRFSYSDP